MMREWQEASSMIEKLIRFGDGDGNEEAPTLRI
jgi:hypothetical protein